SRGSKRLRPRAACPSTPGSCRRSAACSRRSLRRSSAAIVSAASAAAEGSERILPEHRFSTTAPVRLELRVAVGDIDVMTTETEESTVLLDGSERLVDAISVELAGDRLIVQHRQRLLSGWFERFDGSLRVRVQIPHGSRVEIATAAASATLAGRFAALQAK